MPASVSHRYVPTLTVSFGLGWQGEEASAAELARRTS